MQYVPLGNGKYKIPIPKYIQDKNARISAVAITNVLDEIKKMNGTEVAQIGIQMMAGKNDKLVSVLTPAGAKTINEAIGIYMPEIIALTLGSFALGAVAGANWDSIKKLLNR